MASNRPSILSRSATVVGPHILDSTVFGPHIPDSTFLDDIKEDVEKLNDYYKSVKAQLSDAENQQLTKETVRVWVEGLRVISHEAEDALDVWNTVQLKKQISGAANTTGSNPYPLSDCYWLKQLAQEGDFPSRISELNKRLDDINKEKDAYRFTSELVATASEPPQRRTSASFIKASTVCGRDLEIQRLVGDLCNYSGQRKCDPEVISVVGMGGMGKTTLAQLIYNDATVKSHFQKRVWVCVSEPFDEVQVAKSIAMSLGGKPSYLKDLQDILECINKSIAEKLYLLVLDDVWTEDSSSWESLLSSLDSGGDGSKILVTTRNEKCARAIGSSKVHHLGQLSPEESWKLFSQIAFSDKSEEDVENLKEVGQKIAQKCKGLPLALKVVASHLQFKSTTLREWERVLESEIWELETAEKGIFKPLLLSYYDLPSPIKKCFSFCAVFPKDYVFEVKELIRMWMSQGYLNTSRRNEEDMERVGEEYFEHLLTRSFFQDFKEFKPLFKDTLFTSYSCKMHDIVHDFAQFLSKDESLIIDIATENNKKPAAGLSFSTCTTQLRHLTVLNARNSGEDVMSSAFSRSNSKQQGLHLHTLIGMKSFHNLFPHLCFVKALDLSRNGIVEEVPEEIGQFVHLRYLNLSENWNLKRLPGTIYELCNLQTLLLDGCEELRELPEEGIEKLINLRHLEIYYKTVLPKGIGSLSSLRTLNFFNVCRDDGGEVGATIGDLGNLNNLQGSLVLKGLSNVKDGREASKAELRNKKGLTHLRLHFEGGMSDIEEEVIEALEPPSHSLEKLNINTLSHLALSFKGEKSDIEEEVIEALEPPSHSLDELEIYSYSGKVLPRWISSSLTKLRRLCLNYITECEELPPSLGQLPCLETLEISDMNSCKRIGQEFWGIKRTNAGGGGSDDGTKMTTTTSSIAAVAFPKLKRLTFEWMPEWREWEEDILLITPKDDLMHFKLFPCLDQLVFWGCLMLKSLPQFIFSKSPIQNLEMLCCPILEERCRPETGEDWSKISHIPNIKVFDKDGKAVFEIKDGQLQD